MWGRKDKKRKQQRQETNLRVITIKGGRVICKMENGMDVTVNLQIVPFEIGIGDNLDAVIYYTEDRKIETVFIVGKK